MAPPPFCPGIRQQSWTKCKHDRGGQQQPRHDADECVSGRDQQQSRADQASQGSDKDDGAKRETSLGADVVPVGPSTADVAWKRGQRGGCIGHDRRNPDPDERRKAEQSAPAGDSVYDSRGQAGENKYGNGEHRGVLFNRSLRMLADQTVRKHTKASLTRRRRR